MPIVPMTAVRPSRSGRPAATRAPNATSRISSVTGSDSVSAFCEVALEDLHELLLGAGRAELGDVEVRMVLLHRLGDGQRGVDARLGLRERCRAPRRTTWTECLSGEIRPLPPCCVGRGELVRLGQRVHALLEITHDGAVLRIARLQRLALDEDGLAGAGGRLGEGVVLDRLCAAGVTGGLLLGGLGAGAERPAEHEGGDDHGQPPEDGDLAVLGAPAPGPGGDAALGLATHLRTLLGRWIARSAQRPVSGPRLAASHPASRGAPAARPGVRLTARGRRSGRLARCGS